MGAWVGIKEGCDDGWGVGCPEGLDVRITNFEGIEVVGMEVVGREVGCLEGIDEGKACGCFVG